MPRFSVITTIRKTGKSYCVSKNANQVLHNIRLQRKMATVKKFDTHTKNRGGLKSLFSLL